MLDSKFTDHGISSSLHETDFVTQDKIAKPAQVAPKTYKHTRKTQTIAKVSKWSNHVDVIVSKANKVVGLVKRTVGSRNKEINFVSLR